MRATPLPQALPHLPGIFTPIALREAGDAVARAVALAPDRGAGTLCWVGAYARAEAAVVLEPDQPLGAARLALLAAANALADALGALGPAEIPVAFRWPATLLVNGARCGALRLVAPADAAEDAVPDWLVVGMELRLALPAAQEPGATPDHTALAAEGWEAVDGAALTAAWARHLMAVLDEWQARGPRRLSETFLARLADPAATPGLRRGIDPGNGALLLERDGARETWPLVP